MALRAPYPTIDPGEFRHLVTFLDQVTVIDASGVGTDYSPADPPLQAYVKIEPMRAIDVMRAGETASQVYMEITGWYMPEVTPSQRILAPGGSQYVIQSIRNILGMNSFMVMTCVGIGANT